MSLGNRAEESLVSRGNAATKFLIKSPKLALPS